MRGRCKTVGALPQINLVDVELQDLIFGQILLDLECEQHFVQLAGDGLFRRQEEVTSHLHGDRRCPLLLAAGHQIGGRGAGKAEQIDAGVLVEAVIFGSQDGLLQDLWHLADLDHLTALFAEFPDQCTVRRVNPKRDLGLIVGKHIQRRQLRVGKRDQNTAQAEAEDGEQDEGDQEFVEPAQGDDP